MFDFLKKLFSSATDTPTEQNGPQISEQSGGGDDAEVKKTKEESTRFRMQKPPKRV